MTKTINKEFLINEILRKIEQSKKSNEPFFRDPEYKQGYLDALYGLIKKLRNGF